MDPKSITPDARSLEEAFFPKQTAHLLEQLLEKYKT
jgi:hypothetical protein